MTAITLVPPQGGFGNAVLRNLRDGGVITWRNLMNVRRNPELLLGATLQPIMFVLLFAYVFGGSFSGGYLVRRLYVAIRR